MKRIIIVPILMGLGLMLVCGGPGCKGKKTKEAATVKELQAANGIPVETQVVTNGSIDARLQVTGMLKATNEVPISPKIGGRILKIYVNNGDRVQAGDKLVQIETKEIMDQVNQVRAGVQQAEAGVQQAQAGVNVANERLSMAMTGARPQERQQMENLVTQAEQGFAIAKSNLDRMKNLLDAGVIPRQQYDTVKIQYDMAETQYKNAKEQMSLVNEGARDEEKSMARQGVMQAQQARQQALQAKQQAQAGLSFAQEQIKNATIVAPMSGVVASRIFDPGTLVGPGMPYPLMSIIDDSGFSLESDISETDLDKVRIGQNVDLTVDAIPGAKFRGTITRINPAASMGTRTYTIKITLEHSGDPAQYAQLKSGLFCRGNIIVQSRNNTVVIPKDAVQKTKGENVVYITKDKKAIMRKVELGINGADNVEIVSGLSFGDHLVIEGAAGLKDGDKVFERASSVK